MYRIAERRMIVPNLHLLTVEAPAVARSLAPGSFIILRPDEEGERIPLSVADWDAEAGTVSSVFMQVGASTAKLARLKPGATIPTFAGPLGNQTRVEHFGTILLIGGCYGIGSLYPVAKALRQAGNRLLVLLEARSSYLLYWQDRYTELAEKVITLTRDGSAGYRGHLGRLPELLTLEDLAPDRVVVHGCAFQMRRAAEATRPLGITTIVNMNPIMIDGTGMCGVCRLNVAGKTQFACVDGPDFDGHQVDWDEFQQRRRAYSPEEVHPLRRSGCASRF